MAGPGGVCLRCMVAVDDGEGTLGTPEALAVKLTALAGAPHFPAHRTSRRTAEDKFNFEAQRGDKFNFETQRRNSKRSLLKANFRPASCSNRGVVTILAYLIVPYLNRSSPSTGRGRKSPGAKDAFCPSLSDWTKFREGSRRTPTFITTPSCAYPFQKLRVANPSLV